jgi:hypothetical protein
MNNLHFRGPGFEFNAAGPIAIGAAVLIAFLILSLARGYL